VRHARFVIAALFIGCSLALSVKIAVAQDRSGQLPRRRLDPALTIISNAPLRDGVHYAEAIVLVRVTKRLDSRVIDQRPEIERAHGDIVLPWPIPEPITEYDVSPEQVLKPDAPFAFGTLMRVASFGGAAEFDGVIVERESKTPDLIEGRVYLLFLRRWEAQDLMLFDTFDVFDFTGPRVDANTLLRGTTQGKELVGLSPEQALNRIKLLLAGAPQ
jgi:hypothetical protein